MAARFPVEKYASSSARRATHPEFALDYDALDVVLAATLDVPLLTADARLARAPGLPCQVELGA